MGRRFRFTNPGDVPFTNADGTPYDRDLEAGRARAAQDDLNRRAEANKAAGEAHAPRRYAWQGDLDAPFPQDETAAERQSRVSETNARALANRGGERRRGTIDAGGFVDEVPRRDV